MTFRQSIFGEIATRDGQHLASVDVGSLIRRLILFDKVIVKSFRLREIPFLVLTFREAGFARLLDSGLLKFSCEFTTIIFDISVDGVRQLPLHHFSFGIADAANRDADLRSELRCLQSISGLKTAERSFLEESIWAALVRPGPTYGQELLDQVDSDLRRNTPALTNAIVEQLRTELELLDLHADRTPIQIDETSKRPNDSNNVFLI
jgi:hypothetical protein